MTEKFQLHDKAKAILARQIARLEGELKELREALWELNR